MSAKGRRTGIQFTGEIDGSFVEATREALTAALTDAVPPQPVVLDLTEVGFLGSLGLAELLSAHRRATTQGTPLRIMTAQGPVLRTLERTGMTALFDIHPDLSTVL